MKGNRTQEPELANHQQVHTASWLVITARDRCAKSSAWSISYAFEASFDRVICSCYLGVRDCVVLREHRPTQEHKMRVTPQSEWNGSRR